MTGALCSGKDQGLAKIRTSARHRQFAREAFPKSAHCSSAAASPSRAMASACDVATNRPGSRAYRSGSARTAFSPVICVCNAVIRAGSISSAVAPSWALGCRVPCERPLCADVGVTAASSLRAVEWRVDGNDPLAFNDPRQHRRHCRRRSTGSPAGSQDVGRSNCCDNRRNPPCGSPRRPLCGKHPRSCKRALR